MAFDAGMVLAVTRELSLKLENARIDKITMPERDEVHFLLHSGGENLRLVVSASSASPRLHLTDTSKENPKTPPSFCMLLRKHLTASRVVAVRQLSFERALEIEFDFKDELGYLSKKYLILEILGKHSNIIFLDDKRKILGAVHTTDLSSTKRAILPGMTYELPPSQNKIDPIGLEREEFFKVIDASDPSAVAEKVITSSFTGIAPIISREIVYRASGNSSASLYETDKEKLWFHFSQVYSRLEKGDTEPTLLFRKDESAPFEYAFIEIRQYENMAVTKRCESFSSLIDTFFSVKDKSERIKQRAQDIFHLLLKSQNRLLRKIELQESELHDTESMEYCRRCGDLISQEMYRIKRGDKKVVAVDYSVDGYPEVEVALDERLSPSQNAQRYYKNYNRKKNARAEITRQIEEARGELRYIDAVLDSLSRAETESDLAELREELSLWGYGKRDKKSLKTRDKKEKPKPLHFVSPSGLDVYVGKNNLQNDYITMKLGEKNDWWFHTKSFPGSHVLMVVKGEEPPAEDFTFAATLAAKHSSAEGDNIAVDYTLIRHIKKPPQSKPGFVTYSTYWTAVVKVTGNSEE